MPNPEASRVLVVDDRDLICRSISRLLTARGLVADTAHDPEVAISLAARHEYTVALVDYDLQSTSDGMELLTYIANAQPQCARILMTGDPNPRLWVDAINRNVIHSALPKPFNEDQLHRAMDSAQQRLEPLLPGINAVIEGRRALTLFREAVDGDQIAMAVQPIFDAVDPARPVAFECLLRSTHPALPNPHRILETADRAGAFFELGTVVSRLAARWFERIPADALLFVNLDPKQLTDPRLLDQLAPLAPFASRVVLEITERSTLQQIENWSQAIRAVEEAGFQFAVDDLGAGYSGLWLLAELRPSVIKVDMSIVRDCHKVERKRRLIEVLATFADATSARLVAEGVENEHDAATAVAAGAHLVQGYHYARPSLNWPG